MKQKTVKLKSKEEFMRWVTKLQKDEDFINAKEVLFKVMTAQFIDSDARNLHYLLKNTFPKAKIIGVSMTNFYNKFKASGKGKDWVLESTTQVEIYAVISCFFFYYETSHVTIFEVDSKDVNREAGNINKTTSSLHEILKTIPNLKGVEVVCASGQDFLSDGLSEGTKDFENIPFFGALAGWVHKEKIACKYQSIIEELRNENMTQFVMGNEYHNDGIVLAAYSGEDLHICANYNFGWRPIGKEMTVTETIGSTGLVSVDNIPAIEIYKKYLHIVPNEFLMFNVFEFPLLVNRGGIDVARVPAIYDEMGRIYLSTDIKCGEKIRLSYGNPHDLINESEKTGERLKKFGAQALTLYICGARTVFLNEDSELELNIFKKINSEMIYCLSQGEIYKYKGQGGLVGSAVISVGFREGPAKKILTKDLHVNLDKLEVIVPLAKRLASFLEATTDELNATNEHLQDAVKAAEAANKAKSQFLSNMSHEIRTPINAILGMNEMILRESTDSTILEYAENIRSAGNSLLGIVNDILDFSKIEAGKMDIIPVEYSLSSLLNDLVHMVQKRAEKKNLEFHIEADENLPTELYGDEIRIKQIITNILTNAVKYTEKGGVTLKISYKKISEDKILLCVLVKDTGIGIKPEDIKKLFSAFERIEEKRNRTIEGTGLGMNITQGLLSMMGSSLQVSSVYGEGSEFYFELEQKIINCHPIGNFADSYRHSLCQHKKYKEKFIAPDAKILVVDDTVMNLTVVKGLLKQTKIKISTAESGYECLKLVAHKKYDIIFLDHRMPGIDGIETLKRMKILKNNLNLSTPIISLTANAISGARKMYLDAGFQDYLTKPIDSEKLEDILIQYLPKDKVIFKSDESVEETEEEKIPDWLNKISGINVKDGIEHCGDVESYLDALTVFAQSVTAGAKEIADFYRNNDIKNYTVKVHALKSSARVIGANELSEKARRLEDAGNAGYVDEIKKFTDGLLELYISFAEKLSPLIKVEGEDDSKPLIDEDELAEAYETMKEVAQTFDYDSMQFVIQSLEEYKLPPDDAKKFAELKIAASKPDWEKILELLA
ncbi:MAG: response regulator [Selenomonadaceae bacterium]|nr:response regulator [Selenomonadaceae bacterium]